MSLHLPRSVGVLVLLMFPSITAHAQSTAPIQPMNITGFEGDLLFTGHYRIDEETSGNGQVTEEKDIFFREELGLRSSGYFYHPNLVDWSAGLRLGLTQQRIDINNESYDSDGDIFGYNLNALFLKEKPVSVRAYARKTDDFIDRSFARQIELKTRVEGAEVYIKGQTPITLLFEQSDIYEESDIRTDDETSDLFRFQMIDARNPDLFSELVYEHEDVDKTATFFLDGEPPVIQDLPDRRDEVRLTNRWRFPDGDLTHSLYGHLRLLRRRGAFNNDLASFNQRLDLQHSDTLTTFYRIQALTDDTDTQKEDLLEGEVGFIKQYYQSLSVTGRVFATDNKFDSSEEQSYGTFFDFDYRKNTPVGRYNASLGVGTDFQDQSSDSGFRSIRDEAVVLAGVTPQQLSEPNVVPGSVVVTDVNNAVTFIEGVDYTLQQFGQFTEIVRLVTGSIVDGQLVLVDYEVEAAENANIQTNRIHLRQRLQIQDTPFALLTEYRLRDEKLLSGDDPGNLDRQEIIMFGLEYHEDPFTIVGEYEQRDQRLSPSSVSYLVRGTYDQVFNDTMTTTIGADYENLDYTDAEDFDLEPGRDFLDRYGVFAHTTVKLRRDLLTRFEASYNDMKGRDNNKLARIGASLNYRRGNLNFTISGYHEEYEQEDETGDNDVIRFTLRRSF